MLSNSILRRDALTLVLASAFGVSGCTTSEHTKAAPGSGQPISVKLSGVDFSSRYGDLLPGTYRVPKSQIFVSGHQLAAVSVMTTPSFAAGLAGSFVGLGLSEAMELAKGAKAVQDGERGLHLRLDDLVLPAVRRVISKESLEGKFSVDTYPEGVTLTLTPAIVLTFEDAQQIRPFVVLKAELESRERRSLWSTRYFATTGASRPLTGPGGWVDDQSFALKEALQANLELAIKILLTDISTPFPRNDAALVAAEGQFAFYKRRLKLVGYKLAEDEHHVVFAPKSADTPAFAGVHILDKGFATVREITEADSLKAPTPTPG